MTSLQSGTSAAFSALGCGPPTARAANIQNILTSSQLIAFVLYHFIDFPLECIHLYTIFNFFEICVLQLG